MPEASAARTKMMVWGEKILHIKTGYTLYGCNRQLVRHDERFVQRDLLTNSDHSGYNLHLPWRGILSTKTTDVDLPFIPSPV